MKLGPGIRIGLVAVTLLAQLALPVAHHPQIVTGHHPVVASGLTDVSARDSRHAIADHDPSACPVCLALGQARSGIAHTPRTGFFEVFFVVAAAGHQPRLVLPRTPDLVAAPPRAPPVLSLSFA